MSSGNVSCKLKLNRNELIKYSIRRKYAKIEEKRVYLLNFDVFLKIFLFFIGDVVFNCIFIYSNKGEKNYFFVLELKFTYFLIKLILIISRYVVFFQKFKKTKFKKMK